MFSKRELLEAAEEAGFGDRSLGATLNNWQKRGLIGQAAGKAPGRGGEGLWSPVQLDLWLALLRLRYQNSENLPTLARCPVGLWMLRSPGIDMSQAQRAFGFWATGSKRKEPAGNRSLRRQALDFLIDMRANPKASAWMRNALRRQLEALWSGVGLLSAKPPSDFLMAARTVLDPEGMSPQVASRRAEQMFAGVRLRLFAFKYASLLTIRRDDVLSLWEWARDYAHGGDTFEPDERKVAAALARLTPEETDNLSQRINWSCYELLAVFGLAFYVLAGGEYDKAWDPPPQVRGVTLPEEWARAGTNLLPLLRGDISSTETDLKK